MVVTNIDIIDVIPVMLEDKGFRKNEELHSMRCHKTIECKVAAVQT